VLLIASVQLMTILLGVLFWKRNESS
jgi:hypothetical protein